MAGYQPLKITGYETGLVQEREEFLLPDDAYPKLQNAFVWRERIKRKQGFNLLGRLRRIQEDLALGNTDGSGNFTGNLISVFSLEASATFQVGSVVVVNGAITFTDNSLGILVASPPAVGRTGTINYVTGAITITNGAAATPLTVSFNYYPNLPVMGLRTREINSLNNELTIAFDTKYAYQYSNGWEEYIPGTTWTGNNSDFFWSTNYWSTGAPPALEKIFWVTNFSGNLGDPIRFTDGIIWTDFAPPTYGQIDVTNFLTQCLCLLPFRSRLLAFNTFEGSTLAGSTNYPNRIRWSQIGNPFIPYAAGPPATGSWRDDIRGKGGFLDIPTNEDIISVGFVRDNLVIYCEHSTWQLRYTGRSIAPFQIEKVNSELGAESTFSAVQFDTSLVGIGDKGIVECDSFQSKTIDIKIPDLVFEFNNENNGPKRVHGIRDFVQRIAYWIYPDTDTNGVYPDRRLIYNYENDSWAIFTDSLTCLGNFQPQGERTWESDPNLTWEQANFTWGNLPARIPAIIGGNQQGYVEYIGGGLEGGQTTNDVSLYIKNITGFGTGPSDNPISIESPAHNMQTGQVIKIVDIPTGTPFASTLNNNVYQITRTDADNFYINSYNSVSKEFNTPALAASAVYIGGGQIEVRDNFSVLSKKFNYMDQGKQFQLGYIDILMDTTEDGAIALNVYNDYNSSDTSNTLPNNSTDDTFFNSVVPTSTPGISVVGGSKNWHRVFCPTNSNFITIEWTLNNEQMSNQCQESDVQIDAQIIWNRSGGRMGITQ